MNEPGSTAKIMPLVTVFQYGIFEPDDIINVEGGRFSIGRRVIRDDHPYDFLRCDEVGIYSSNIGVSKMGMAAGSDLIYRTLVQFGFGERTGIDFPGESAGVLRDPSEWNDHLLANICFGYGITATGIQLAAAYGVIAGEGELKKPFFVAKMSSSDGSETILNSTRVVRRVLDRPTIEIMDKILREVVITGTARKADDEFLLLSGKTGTALRTFKDRKGYDRSRSLASFAGYFPASNPKVVGIIMFDEPKSSIYGGEVAAPVFRKTAVRYGSLPRNHEMLNPPSMRFKSVTLAVNAAAGGNGIKANFRPIEKEVVFEPLDPSVLPDFVGVTMREAMNEARTLGLTYKVRGSGVVKTQSPSPGAPIGKVESLELVGDL